MTARSPFTHVLVIEDDPHVARAVASLALDVLSHEPHLIVGAAGTAEAASELVLRVAGAPDDRVLVVCAARLAGETSGLAVLDKVERACPQARVILLTEGEREDLARGLVRPVHGIVQKPVVLPELRAILKHVASDAARAARWPTPQDSAATPDVRRAADALETALEAVEVAHDRLRRATPEAAPQLRWNLVEAERLALLAHRRVLEVERVLEVPETPPAPPRPDP